MFQTKEELVEQLKASGAQGSPAALVTAVWDLLNLPGSGKMGKVSGVMVQKTVHDSKGILVQVRVAGTMENTIAIEQMRQSGNGLALLTQEPEETVDDEDPNQGHLPLDEEDENAE